MSRHMFWMGIAFAVGALFLLPTVAVGTLAIVNGLATGNQRLALTGAGFAGGALLVAGLLWWVVRRSRSRGDAEAN